MMKRHAITIALVLAAVAALCSAGHCQSYVVYVNKKATGTGTGENWTNAKTNIQSAIQWFVNYGRTGEVRIRGFSDGTVYSGSGSSHIHLANGVTLKGGYYGLVDGDQSRDTSENPTTVTVIQGTSADCVIEVPASVTNTAGTVLEYLTIRSGGGHTGSYSAKYGGGIYCEGKPTISHCTITGNSATYGAGIYAANLSTAAPVICNNTITANNGITTAPHYGVGVYLYYGTLNSNVISDNRFYTNPGYGNSGGGVYIGSYGSLTSFTGNTITGNGWPASQSGTMGVVTSSGGGVYVSSANSITISGNTISGNRAGSGGGVYASSPGSLIDNTTISGNYAYYQGGGVYAASSWIVEHNTIENNTSAGDGGGIYYAGTGNITRNTIKSNSANASTGRGGNICWSATSSAPGKVFCNIIASSSSAQYGTGVCIITAQAGSVFANNTLVDNTGTALYLDNPASGCTIYNSIFKGSSCGVQANSGYYMLSHNCFYGNTTNWIGNAFLSMNITSDPGLINYRIADGSPCVDTGDDTVVESGWSDIDDECRQVDLPYQGVVYSGVTTKVDIGADEVQDTADPSITGISANPSVIKYYPDTDPDVGETTTITFYVSEPLAADPDVRVNQTPAYIVGHTSDDINKFESYACTYRAQSSDPAGYATIVVYGGDANGRYGRAETDNTLWITKTITFQTNRSTGTRTITNANGTSVTYTYDERGRLRQVKNRDANGDRVDAATLNYTVDGVGNRKEIWFGEDTAKKNIFGYDALNRLTSADYYTASGITDTTWAFDWVGNRTLINTTSYSYDIADRLDPFGVYRYDDYGSLSRAISSPTDTLFEYDARGLLKAVSAVPHEEE